MQWRLTTPGSQRQPAPLMVPHDWIWLASTQPVQSCPLPPLCLLRQFVAGLRVASVRSSEGSPATINSRSVIHGVAHVLRLGVSSREFPPASSPPQFNKLGEEHER